MKLSLILIFFTNTIISFGQWSEVGDDIIGTEDYPLLGRSRAISGDGNRVANAASNGPGEISLIVYEEVDGEWVILGDEILSEPYPAMGGFGRQVALNYSGDIVALSGFSYPDADPACGFVMIFQLIDDEWIQLGESFVGGYGENIGRNGIVLNADGNRIAASVPGSNEFGLNVGAVRIYEYIDDEWVQIGGAIPGTYENEKFPYDLDMDGSGDRIITGSVNLYDDDSPGEVKVFEYDGTAWNQLGETFTGEDGSYTATVSISGSGGRIAFGAGMENNGGGSIGTVRVYEEFDDEWFQVGEDLEGTVDFTNVNRPKLNWEGCMLAMAEDNLYKAPEDIGPDYSVGVFNFYDGAWNQIDELITVPLTMFTDYYRRATFDMGSNGNRLIVGDDMRDGISDLKGYIRLYENPMASCEPCEDTYAEWDRTACLSYTVPSGDETYEESGVYLDTIPNFCGGDSLLTISVEILPLPDVGATVSPDKICFGQSAIFNGTGAISYVWDNDVVDGVPFYPESEGTFVYTVVGTAEGEGCVNEASISLTVLTDPLLSAEHDTIIDLGGAAILTAITASEGGYSWSPEWEVPCVDCAQIMVEPDQTTYYYVEFTDLFECKSVDSVLVYVNPQISLGVPDAFSPNGDGNNDVLFVQGVGIEALNFQVFNRYGENVFTSTDQNIGWDGTFQNRELNAGVFTWLLHYNFSDGNTGIRKGTVTLIK